MKEAPLMKCLVLPKAVPSKDVFCRVLAALKPDIFQACYAEWMGSMQVPQP